MDKVKINEELFSNILNEKIGFLFVKTVESLIEDELKKITPVEEWDINLCSDEEQKKAGEIVIKKIIETKRQVLYDRSPALYVVEKTIIRNHKDMVHEVIERINEHQEEISKKLLNGKPFVEVTKISNEGSDIHNHGRTPLLIATPEGKFFYKPHDCAPDEFSSKLVEAYFSDIMYVPKVLNYGNYGFCEFIVNEAANGKEEASAYYRNLGGVAALICVLGGTDFHCENFLANGKYPIPIDLEAVITPVVKYFYEKEKTPDFLIDYNFSIAQSGLLPKIIDGDQFSLLFCTNSKNVGAPIVDGKVQTVRGYEDEFFEGFDMIYDRCIELREQIAFAVSELKSAHIRKLLRNTGSYNKVLIHLNSPAAANNSQEQQKVYDSLGKYFEDNKLKELMGIPQAEIDSLSERDIPYFYSFGDSVDLYSDGKKVAKNFFKFSAIDHVLLRLERLGPEEKQFEKSIISRSIEYAIIDKTPTTNMPNLSNVAPMKKEEALEIAGKLLKQIYDSSIISRSGKRGFIGYMDGRDKLSCLQSQFANGLGGICTFAFGMSFLDSRWNDTAKDFSEMYQDYMNYYVQSFSDAKKIPPEYIDLGLASGFAGIVTTLYLAKRFMPELDLCNMLESVLSILDVMPIKQCEASDVYSGLSGLILSLYRIREIVDVKKYVLKAADRLLELKTLEWKEFMLWNTIPKTMRAISGFGHGCGGIGLALFRAWEMTKEERYYLAAKEAYAFEHNVYSEKIKTWPDFRTSPIAERSQNGICSGAPGIALCLKGAQKGELPFTKIDMERALEAIRNQPMLSRDILCCGNCSSVEALITLNMQDEAAALLGKINKMSKINGNYSFMPPDVEQFFVPSLFYGAAGLGYTLIRFVDPNSIPSLFI